MNWTNKKRVALKAHKKSGFTLTEIAVVLGVIGTILGAIWAAAAHVSDANKVQRSVADTMQIFSSYKGLYGDKGIDGNGATFTDVTCTGITNGYFPPDLPATGACVTGTTTTYPVNPWGGYVRTWVQATTNQIMIEFDNVPQSACNSLANALWSNDADVIYEGLGNRGAAPSYLAQALGPRLNATSYPPTKVSATCQNNNDNYVQVGFAVR